MGWPENESDRETSESPQHEVTLAQPLAVSKFEVTFEEWDACAAAVGCPRVADRWGRGQMPVINASSVDAKQYVAWLSQSLKPNAFGFHDMRGNVWEWVEDTWHQNYDGAPTDGSAWLRGRDPSYRVIRGGSWRNESEHVRAAVRFKRNIDVKFDTSRLTRS